MSSTTVMLLPVIRKRRKNIEKMNIKPQDSYNNIRQNNYTIFNCILCDKKSHFPYLLIYSKCFPRISFQFNWNVIDESAALLPKHLQTCLWNFITKDFTRDLSMLSSTPWPIGHVSFIYIRPRKLCYKIASRISWCLRN